MKSMNEGETFSPETLAALANRGIKLSLDVYDGSYGVRAGISRHLVALSATRGIGCRHSYDDQTRHQS